jgi:Transposase, Mutator family
MPRWTVSRAAMDGLSWVRKQIEQADTDLLREMVKLFCERVMGEEADAICGASYGSDERTNRRNGYRTRTWDTRTGTIDIAVPKLREGSHFPDWLLEPRRRAERAFVQVVCESYVRGVSTRRVEGLVRHLGIERISKSRVSQMAKELDQAVEDFRSRPLDGAPYTYARGVSDASSVGRVRDTATCVVIHSSFIQFATRLTVRHPANGLTIARREREILEHVVHTRPPHVSSRTIERAVLQLSLSQSPFRARGPCSSRSASALLLPHLATLAGLAAHLLDDVVTAGQRPAGAFAKEPPKLVEETPRR